jgi:hypothetical protein
MYELNAEMRSQGVPPHWMVYFAADNADATAAKARQLGAQIIKEPFDVMDIGRMSVITDPTGAFFCIWQSKGGAGLRAQTSIGGPCWPELTTKDRQTAERFYTGLFGWGLKKSEPYTEVQVGGNSVGGIMQMDEKWGPAPSHWGIYFLVANADESAAKAGELGAKVCVPPTDIPNVGRFAVLNDPQGAAFSIIQLSHPM